MEDFSRMEVVIDRGVEAGEHGGFDESAIHQ